MEKTFLKDIKNVKNQFRVRKKNHEFDFISNEEFRKLRRSTLIGQRFNVGKRIFDFTFSLFVCVFVLSWLFPILGALIRLESKGKVIFSQNRSGLYGIPFRMYKFRSMRKNDFADIKTAEVKDNRVTKIGIFIRKYSIDEFPQFWNVLIGDMSIVGPRPHMLKHTEDFDEMIPNFMLRHLVKPGITGLAQIRGRRGGITKKQDIFERFKLDLFYIEKWRLILDLKIILRTAPKLFKRERRAY